MHVIQHDVKRCLLITLIGKFWLWQFLSWLNILSLSLHFRIFLSVSLCSNPNYTSYINGWFDWRLFHKFQSNQSDIYKISYFINIDWYYKVINFPVWQSCHVVQSKLSCHWSLIFKFFRIIKKKLLIHTWYVVRLIRGYFLCEFGFLADLQLCGWIHHMLRPLPINICKVSKAEALSIKT